MGGNDEGKIPRWQVGDKEVSIPNCAVCSTTVSRDGMWAIARASGRLSIGQVSKFQCGMQRNAKGSIVGGDKSKTTDQITSTRCTLSLSHASIDRPRYYRNPSWPVSLNEKTAYTPQWAANDK